MTKIDICIETGAKKVFASAMAWPGWSRAAKTEELAIEAVADHAGRYAPVAVAAGLELPAKLDFVIVERLDGNATTDFGAPGVVADSEYASATPKQTDRFIALLEASWQTLDDVYDGSSAQLLKGPRGGGRDRDKMYQHALSAERSYASQLGVKIAEPSFDDNEAINAMRDAIVEGVQERRSGKPKTEKGWPMRYTVRRMAWHNLDHAWEMQDKQT